MWKGLQSELSETFISISFKAIMTISQSLRWLLEGEGTLTLVSHLQLLWCTPLFLAHSDFLTFVLASVSWVSFPPSKQFCLWAGNREHAFYNYVWLNTEVSHGKWMLITNTFKHMFLLLCLVLHLLLRRHLRGYLLHSFSFLLIF